MRGVDADLERLLGSPRAARAGWLLALLAGREASPDPADLVPQLGPFIGRPESFSRMVGFWGQRLGTFEAVGAATDDEGALAVALRDGKGRPWTLRCHVGTTPPYALEFYSIMRPLPPGVHVRAAHDGDADALGALESACPIERDDGSRVTLVRGRYALDQLRLADWAILLLAEEAGHLVACYALATHRARLGGREQSLAYFSHTRILPSHRRLGLNETLMMLLTEERFRRRIPTDGSYVYVDPRNEIIRDWSPAVPWRARPLRASLSCAALAGAAAGRVATRDDAARIAMLLEAAHGSEEMFLPPDVSRLTTRLTRAPECYGFDRMLIADDAVVGVGEGDERRILERADLRDETRRATVIDWGCDGERGLVALESLLRCWCSRLAERGTTHLLIFFSDASPAAKLLHALAESVVEIELRSSLPEPPDSGVHGVYVDPVYY